MTVDHGREEPPPRAPQRISIAKVIFTLLLAGLLGISALVGASVNAYYAPHNMTRAQFEVSAKFGAWNGEGDQAWRSFVLETRDATIAGQETRAMVAQGEVPFGRSRLKGSAIARSLLIPAFASFVLVWGVPWAVAWIGQQIRRGSGH